jgi:hypothetical protein
VTVVKVCIFFVCFCIKHFYYFLEYFIISSWFDVLWKGCIFLELAEGNCPSSVATWQKLQRIIQVWTRFERICWI